MDKKIILDTNNSIDDDWKNLCLAYIDADLEEKSTWWAILIKYQAIANGSSTDRPTVEQMTAHFNALQALDAVKKRMDIFMMPPLGRKRNSPIEKK